MTESRRFDPNKVGQFPILLLRSFEVRARSICSLRLQFKFSQRTNIIARLCNSETNLRALHTQQIIGKTVVSTSPSASGNVI